MPLIGDELRTILGMMPTRDRAGIARGTMADDAMRSSAAADSGNAEGAALMQQGQRPPQIQIPPQMRGGDGAAPQLPDDVPTAFASGRGDGGAPPVPQERVVASGPAAAPPAGVATRASDVAMAVLEQQHRQQKMMQLVGSLGLIANAFNRNPTSAASTRSSLADMIGGGGAGGHGGNALGDIKTIQDMRRQEDADITLAQTKSQMVDNAMRMFGLSKQDAEARFSTGELQKLFDPATIKTREADQRAGRVRMDLSDPAVITEIAKRTGSPEAVVKADIANGKIGQKEIADILHTQAQSGKLGADTAEARRATGEAEKADRAFAFYKDNPEAFAQLHGIKDVNEARAIVSDRKNYDKYQETSGPTAYGPEAGYTRAKREGYTGTRADWEKVKDTKDSPEDKAYGQSLVDQVKEFGESQKSINERVNNMVGARAMQEASISDDLIVGSKLSDMTLNARKVAAKALGYADTAAENTDVFKKLRDAQALQLQQTLKGQTSNADVEWLKGIAGSDEMSVASLRRLMLLQDKADRIMIEQHNKRLADAQASDSGKSYRGYKPVNYPPPGPLLSELLRSKPQDVAAMKAADPNDAQMQKGVREKYGPGVFEFVREHM
jgi:hypothetical protein